MPTSPLPGTTDFIGILTMAVVCLLAYLLGSVPFGLILARLSGYGDIRKIGSGNIGATNVLRTGNRLLALATLLCDGTKGALAVWIGFKYGAWSFLPALMG